MAETHGIPLILAERFSNVFAALVDEVRKAVADAAAKPELAQAPASRAWQGKALPLLEQSDAAVKGAAAAFARGEAHALLAQAEDKRGLAKDMDGFALSFAGPEHAEKLEMLLTAVVAVAYQICEAAGIR
jgi:hypothetical protein